jgi:hypothetical protein
MGLVDPENTLDWWVEESHIFWMISTTASLHNRTVVPSEINAGN